MDVASCVAPQKSGKLSGSMLDLQRSGGYIFSMFNFVVS